MLEGGGIEPRTPMVLITSTTSDAARQVLVILLAANLRIKRDFWVDLIPAHPPFVVHLSPELPEATVNALQAAVDSIADAMMC